MQLSNTRILTFFSTVCPQKLAGHWNLYRLRRSKQYTAQTFQIVYSGMGEKKLWHFLVLYGKLPVSFFHYMTVFVRTDRNILGWWADSSRWSLLKPQRLKSWWLNAANSLPLANTCFQFWQCRVFERDKEWKVLWSAQLSKAQILYCAEGKNNLQQILENRRVETHGVSRECWNLQADVLKRSSSTLLRLLHYSAFPLKINCALFFTILYLTFTLGDLDSPGFWGTRVLLWKALRKAAREH